MGKHITRKNTIDARTFKAECQYRRAAKRREEPLDVQALANELHIQQRLMATGSGLALSML